MGLEVKGLSLVRDSVPFLQDIDLSFERGQITTIIGRTLAGKTSLLRSIAGLQEGVRGVLSLDGRPYSTLPPWKRNVAMVYQQFINYPHLNVHENVAFSLRRRHVPEDTLRQRVTLALKTVGLGGLESRKPSELSGGQQQRVALARALCRYADVLLLDEPLVNLDYKLREQLREELRSLLRVRADTIVIYTTTEPAEAMQLGDQMVVMHEGRVVQAGSPAEIFDRPASAVVGRTVNDPPMTLFDGRLQSGRVTLQGDVVLHVAPHMAGIPEGSYRFGLRAGEAAIGGDTIEGRVAFMEVTGSETSLYLDSPCGALTVQREGVHPCLLGSPVRIGIPATRLFVFEAATGALVAAPTPRG
jgi:glycerol transport system ATP-binding protein